MNIKELATRLRAVENKLAFSKACGVSRATIYRICSGYGANPTLKVLEQIEKQLRKEGK